MNKQSNNINSQFNIVCGKYGREPKLNFTLGFIKVQANSSYKYFILHGKKTQKTVECCSHDGLITKKDGKH